MNLTAQHFSSYRICSIATIVDLPSWLSILLLCMILLPCSYAAGSTKRVSINEALKTGIVDIEIKGKNSIEALTSTFTKKTKKDISVVIPPGTYFVAETNRDTQAFWSTDSLEVLFSTSTQASVEIPVIKYAPVPGIPGKETQFFVEKPPNEIIPKLLDFMLKDGMSYEAKQLAVSVIYNPNLTRDKIDSTYYMSYSGPVFYTEEAIKAEDPIYAFIALRRMEVRLEDIKLYTEVVSLVYALGSQSISVRDYALSELIRLGALNKSFAKSKDFTAALIEFTKHSNRSVQYRAVLGLKEKSGHQVINALLPLITNDSTIYRFPSIIAGNAITRTISETVIEILKKGHKKYEGILTPLLVSQDYKKRLAGIEIFSDSKSEKIKSILSKLSIDDEYREVREAAQRVLQEKK